MRSLLDTMVIIRAQAGRLAKQTFQAEQAEGSLPGVSALQWSAGIGNGILEVIDDYEATLPGRPISARSAAQVPLAES